MHTPPIRPPYSVGASSGLPSGGFPAMQVQTNHIPTNHPRRAREHSEFSCRTTQVTGISPTQPVMRVCICMAWTSPRRDAPRLDMCTGGPVEMANRHIAQTRVEQSGLWRGWWCEDIPTRTSLRGYTWSTQRSLSLMEVAREACERRLIPNQASHWMMGL